MPTFGSVSDALELLVHSYDDVPGNWPDVLARAGESEPSGRPASQGRARLFMAFAFLMVAAALVATAFATGITDRFSAWVSGSPGSPAPSSVQKAFARRNAFAYASFPQGTKLRLLLSKRVAGTRFELLGFQNGDTYCLRLIRADLPSGIGENVCLRAAELDGTQAVVAGDARFQVGNPAVNIQGVYGFVADDIRSLTIARLRSAPAQADPVSNVFLSLRSQPAGSAHNHPLADPVTTVTVTTKAGKRSSVPYISEDSGRFSATASGHLTTPSYFGPGTRASLGGPNKVAYRASDSIAWLDRREPRGDPFPAGGPIRQRGTVGFGRVIQPDPASPERVGVLLYKRSDSVGPPQPLHFPTATSLCLAQFGALARQPEGMTCNPIVVATGHRALPATKLTHPLMVGSYLTSAVTVFTGLASDSVTSISLYLTDGRVVKAALNTNVFSVSAAAGELPGKLVAYDRQGRPIAISKVGGEAPVTVRPCPTPALPATPPTTVKPWEQINLQTLEVDGHPILGRTVAQVIAALGKPTHRVDAYQIENGVSLPELLYGGKYDSSSYLSKGGSPVWRYQAGLVIDFIKHGSKIVANDLTYTTPNLTDSHLGKLLQLEPATLQRKAQAAYGSTFQLKLVYGSDPAFGCTGTFVSDSSPRGFRFGLHPYLPTHPYLTIDANAPAQR